MMHLRDSGGQSTIAKVRLRDAGGLSVIAKGKLRDGGGLSEIFSSNAGLPLTPDYLSGYGASNTAIFITTNQPGVITNAPSGATIVWNFVGSGITAVSPGQATTLFRGKCPAGVTKTATVSATVNGVETNSITVEIENGGIL